MKTLDRNDPNKACSGPRSVDCSDTSTILCSLNVCDLELPVELRLMARSSRDETQCGLPGQWDETLCGTMQCDLTDEENRSSGTTFVYFSSVGLLLWMLQRKQTCIISSPVVCASRVAGCLGHAAAFAGINVQSRGGPVISRAFHHLLRAHAVSKAYHYPQSLCTMNLRASDGLRYALSIQVSKDQRNQAKQLTYAVLYGLGAYALAQKLNTDPASAAQLSRSFLKSMPGLEAWMKGVVEDCRMNGYVTMLSGRRRYLPDIHSVDPAVRQYALCFVQGLMSFDCSVKKT
eukprot:scaffold17778_cov22-Tisochrysis_lutea.AAC.1